MCISFGKTLAVFRNYCLSQHSKKTYFFLRKKVFSVVFIELKCRWLQTGLADLESTKHLYFFLMVDVLCILENITFFEMFVNYNLFLNLIIISPHLLLITFVFKGQLPTLTVRELKHFIISAIVSVSILSCDGTAYFLIINALSCQSIQTVQVCFFSKLDFDWAEAVSSATFIFEK